MRCRFSFQLPFLSTPALRAVPVVAAGVLVALALSGCSAMGRRGGEPAGYAGGEVTTPAESPVVHAPPMTWLYPESPSIPDGMSAGKLVKQVTFPPGSAALNNEARGALGQAVDAFKVNSAWHVLVVGFADNRGEAAGGSALSVQRAEAVRSFLRERGVDSGRLHMQGLGSAHARAGEYEAMQQELDRRVEVWSVNP